MIHLTPLSRILENKRVEVLERQKKLELEDLIPLVQPTERHYQGGFILECKKTSPSLGVIRQDFSIDEIAKAYAPFAGAISVLTDEVFFEGKLEYLTRVSQQVACPVLCKDFIVSPYQIYEARLYQADMVLLMLSVLNDADYRLCAEAARLLNMDVLTEVHDESELERALNLEARIIGVNNRDFKTLKVDLDVSRRLLSHIPKSVIKVVESGMESHAHILEFKHQVDGFLIGTSLMRAKNLDWAVRELLFGRIKICGLTLVEDAQMAYNSGASFGGLIFVKESPRHIDLKTALFIVQKVHLRWVGVFVNESIQKICDFAIKLHLFAIQLHGEETDNYVVELKKRLPQGIEIWRRLSPGPQICFRPGDRYLFDTEHENLRGGTGKSFDWSLIPKSVPKDRVILSGGLGVHNIKQAERLGFWALDVNSSVEEKPGKKDHKKIENIFASSQNT